MNKVFRLHVTVLASFAGALIISQTTIAQTKKPAAGKTTSGTKKVTTLGRVPDTLKTPEVVVYPVDKKMLAIPDSLTSTPQGIASYINAHFTTASDKARAAFIWVATNIRYDIDNMYALNFYEEEQETIMKPLRTRKGICANYAALFSDICQRAGIKSFVVTGYTKQNGRPDFVPHAWSVAKIDTAWNLFDPTWGAGHADNGKFVPEVDNTFYRISPEKMLESHMPFDYLWQLYYYPITNGDFANGRTMPDKANPYFNFPDSIAVFENQSKTDYYIASLARIKNSGVSNSLLYDRVQHLEDAIQKGRIIQYNQAVADYNASVLAFNDYGKYWNKQFTPMKPDADIQAMLDSTSVPLHEAKRKLDNITNPDSYMLSSMTTLRKQMDDMFSKLEEQQTWLNKYFTKGKSARHSMFYVKVNMWGKPVK